MFLFWPAVKRRLVPELSTVRRIFLAGMTLIALMGPDADVSIGLLTGRPFAETHNYATHSLFAGFLFAVFFAFVSRRIVGGRWRFFFIIALTAYSSHVMLDALTWGRGVQLFWPFSEDRFAFPFFIFRGVRHSSNVPWTSHLWTVANDLTFALVVFGLRPAIRRLQAFLTKRAAPDGSS